MKAELTFVNHEVFYPFYSTRYGHEMCNGIFEFFDLDLYNPPERLYFVVSDKPHPEGHRIVPLPWTKFYAKVEHIDGPREGESFGLFPATSKWLRRQYDKGARYYHFKVDA